MADSKAQERIRAKNKRQKSRKPKKEAPEAAEASEGTPEKVVPTGPEPAGMKERVKRGFLTERDALRLLAKSTTTASPQIVGWLRRRL